MNELINKLEIYRLEHRISQKKLSEMLGVTCATVNRWFKGHTSPNKIQAYQIEKLLKEQE
ncbi:MAG: helix-turn-helix transcriptional regulator [Elusimicrobiaceae bacterium]|nr:helix-turn-helix transcriptional regulator [Alphaproteobacteria bacterium]MBR3603983.1 helix-turn-helix transcriptional regulator [Elusimicrobiaceae bacterium]